MAGGAGGGEDGDVSSGTIALNIPNLRRQRDLTADERPAASRELPLALIDQFRIGQKQLPRSMHDGCSRVRPAF